MFHFLRCAFPSSYRLRCAFRSCYLLRCAFPCSSCVAPCRVLLALRLAVFFLRCAFPCSCVAPCGVLLALRLSFFVCASCLSIVFRLRFVCVDRISFAPRVCRSFIVCASCVSFFFRLCVFLSLFSFLVIVSFPYLFFLSPPEFCVTISS